MSAVGGGGSAVTVRTSVKAGHAAWPGQVMPADLTPNSRVTTQVIMFILFLLPCKIINSWISMSDQILFDQFSTTHRLDSDNEGIINF